MAAKTKEVQDLFYTEETRESVGLNKLPYPEQAKAIFETLKLSIRVQAKALEEIDKIIETKSKESSV